MNSLFILISRRRTLLSIEEAWNLPISAEMSSRQQQQSSQQSRSSAQGFQKPYSQMPQGPPPPYPTPTGSNKRFKSDTGEQKISSPTPNPSFYLNQQQLQHLHCLQQSASNLTPQQQVNKLIDNF